MDRPAPEIDRDPKPRASEPDPAAPESARPPPAAEMLLGLQRSVGNHAVAGLLQRDPLKVKEKPVLDAWDVKLEPTGHPAQGAGKPRVIKGSLKEGSPKVFVGDAVIVRAHIKHLDDATYRSLAASFRLEGGVEVGDTQRQGAEVLSWRLTFKSPGTARATFDVDLNPGAPALDLTIKPSGYHAEFHVVQDIEHFALSCISTQSKLLSSFMAATERLNQAGNALRVAYNEQKADLDDVSSAEKMADDLVLGVVLGAAGGLAGGALGGWMKRVADGKYAKADHVIDAAKDTLKFGVRSVQKFSSGGGRTTTAGDSTAPTTDELPRLRGDRAPTGEDPLEFLTRLAARVSNEGRQAQDVFTAVVEKARTSGADEFDENPADVLQSAQQLEAIATELHIDRAHYVRKLWQSWLEHYAYKAVGGEVQDRVVRKIKKKIDAAAKSVGDDGDDWVRQYAPKAKIRAQEEADKQEKFHGGTFGYG
jgi:hypothetical protein